MGKRVMTIGDYYEMERKYGSLGVKVNTPYGFRRIEAVGITAYGSKVVKVVTGLGKSLETSPDHLIKTSNGRFMKVKNLLPGNKVRTIDGVEEVVSIEILGGRRDLYDIQVEEVKQYYSNGIVSHNSSIIDSLMYVLFNTTAKNNRKNLDIINQNKDSGRGKVVIRVGEWDYVIERESEKYVKKLKGVETLEAKTEVRFWKSHRGSGEKVSLNGVSRNDTDKNIRRMFGTMEDFLLTSLSSQHGSMVFLNEGSTKRKEILAKFLDLELFDRKFRLAKEESSSIKGALKMMEGEDFDEKLLEIERRREENVIETREIEDRCVRVEESIEGYGEELLVLERKVASTPTQLINREEELGELERIGELVGGVGGIEDELEESRGRRDKLLHYLEKVGEFEGEFAIQDYLDEMDEIEESRGRLGELLREIEDLEGEDERERKKVELLSEVPCGPEFSQCKFIKDAYDSRRRLEELEVEVEDIRRRSKEVEGEIEERNPDKVSDYIGKYEEVVKKRERTEIKIKDIDLEIERSSNIVNNHKNQMKVHRDRIREYDQNEGLMKELHGNIESIDEIRGMIEEGKKELSECNDQLLEFHKKHGYYEQEISNIEEKKRQLSEYREQYSAYNLFQRCMHPNGISYEVIKRKLPIINEEISRVLSNIVDFEIFIENDGNRMNVYLKHPKYGPRPVEMGSGSEKTLAAMAIRLALTNITTLPVGSVFVLDEPATDLDQDNLEGFIRILDIIKNQFGVVFLISHLDSLKDAVDDVMVIDKVGSYARVVI